MQSKINRRSFIFSAGAAALLSGTNKLFSAPIKKITDQEKNTSGRKLIIIQFGGGLRSKESIDDPKHRYIPKLWNNLVPKGILFTNIRVEHKVVHPNSTGSIMTGHWEYDDIDWSRPVANPTIFEIFRKANNAPDTSAWAFVYASILAKTGESSAPGYGKKYAANVVEPPTIPRSASDKIDRLMQKAAVSGSKDSELKAAKESINIARSEGVFTRAGLQSSAAKDFFSSEIKTWKNSTGTTSHDAFLTKCAISCMKKFAPDVMAVDYGEIDCAHYGSWSRYVDAIRRTDELTWRIWNTVEALPGYRGKTLILILPDHGRELDKDGKAGFIHHSDFYTNKGADEGCRRVWMLVLGPGIASNKKIDLPIPITAAAATGLEFLGVEASPGAAGSVMSRV